MCFEVASHPDLDIDIADFDSDMDIESLPRHTPPRPTTQSLQLQVRDLQVEVERLRECLQDSLAIQRNMLRHWAQTNKRDADIPVAQHQPPMVTSTPYTLMAPKAETTPVNTKSEHRSTFLQSHSSELNNTSRVIAAALHQAKLEPPVFAGDVNVHPEDWLQAVNIYRSSLNLTDTQTLNELPHFLAKEPSKWFKVLSPHVVTWTQFCQLFRTVFLPSDNQECVLRGILDCVQAPEEPLPTFVAHMLSEFNKLKSPPPEREQIELISKHSLEKYRVALYGTLIPSVMDLLLRARELHTVLGPGAQELSPAHPAKIRNSEPLCFKCSRPGFTSRTCPTCSAISPRALTPMQSSFHSVSTSPVTQDPDMGEPKTESANASEDAS